MTRNGPFFVEITSIIRVDIADNSTWGWPISIIDQTNVCRAFQITKDPFDGLPMFFAKIAHVSVDNTEWRTCMISQMKVLAVASWQVTCNITRPKERQNKCCVTFSAYYNDSVIPYNTCACGWDDLPDDRQCSTKAHAMLLPPNALLAPFDNHTNQAIAWSNIKHYPQYDPMPCPDNCGVSINWHVDADYKSGWTARMTLFNRGNVPFENWFAAVQVGQASQGFERFYSFNGTLLKDLDNTIFLQGLKGMDFLIAETNGSKSSSPWVPGKQQSILSFTKKIKRNLDISKGDGFPIKLLFNGEECALPKVILTKNGSNQTYQTNSLLTLIFTSIVTFLLMTNRIHLTWRLM